MDKEHTSKELSQLRERVAEIIRMVHKLGGYDEAWDFEDEGIANVEDVAQKATDQILSLLTLPSVRLKCSRCNGDGAFCNAIGESLETCLSHEIIPCTCQNGYRDYVIWMIKDVTADMQLNCDSIATKKWPLALPDLMDEDVAIAYGHLMHCTSNFLDMIDKTYPIEKGKGHLKLIEGANG